MRHQKKNHTSEGLLERFEQRVLRLGRHLLHRLDQHHAPAVAKGMLAGFLNHLTHAVHADLLAVVGKKRDHIGFVSVQHAAASLAAPARLVFGRTKQGAGQRPGKGPLAKPARARQQICVHHLPVNKLVRHHADARIKTLIKGERGRRRAGCDLCQCGSFPGVTA